MKEFIIAATRNRVHGGTFKEVMNAEIAPSANALTARSALPIEHKITCKVCFGARYVIGGHRDWLEEFIVYGYKEL